MGNVAGQEAGESLHGPAGHRDQLWPALDGTKPAGQHSRESSPSTGGICLACQPPMRTACDTCHLSSLRVKVSFSD